MHYLCLLGLCQICMLYSKLNLKLDALKDIYSKYLFRKAPFSTLQDPKRQICQLSSPYSCFGSCCKRASRRFADCKFAHGGAAPLSPPAAAAAAAVADSAVASPGRPPELGRPASGKIAMR